tara:strand:- start:76 stop:1917 length:1842 start_codon:yes stop_codon:yes gene_type:complete
MSLLDDMRHALMNNPLSRGLPRYEKRVPPGILGGGAAMGGMKQWQRRFPKKEFDPLSNLDSIDRKQKIDDIMAASRGADINQTTGVRRVPAGTPELKGPKPWWQQRQSQPKSEWMPQSFPGNIGNIASQMNYMRDPQRLQHKNQALETLKVFGSNMANMARHPIDTAQSMSLAMQGSPEGRKVREDMWKHMTDSPSNLMGDLLSMGAVQGRGAAPRAPAPKRLRLTGPEMKWAELIPEPQAQIGNRPQPKAIEHQPQLQLENKPPSSRIPEGSPNRFSKKPTKSYGKAPQDWEISRKNMGQFTDKYGSFISPEIRANTMAPRIPATPDFTVTKPKSPEELFDFFSDEGGIADLEQGTKPPTESWKKSDTEKGALHPQINRLRSPYYGEDKGFGTYDIFGAFKDPLNHTGDGGYNRLKYGYAPDEKIWFPGLDEGKKIVEGLPTSPANNMSFPSFSLPKFGPPVFNVDAESPTPAKDAGRTARTYRWNASGKGPRFDLDNPNPEESSYFDTGIKQRPPENIDEEIQHNQKLNREDDMTHPRLKMYGRSGPYGHYPHWQDPANMAGGSNPWFQDYKREPSANPIGEPGTPGWTPRWKGWDPKWDIKDELEGNATR